jgi:hypothetical protein
VCVCVCVCVYVCVWRGREGGGGREGRGGERMREKWVEQRSVSEGASDREWTRCPLVECL